MLFTIYAEMEKQAVEAAKKTGKTSIAP